MALLPSGMGWSAEENYMKQYAGTIADISEIDSQLLVELPVCNTVADMLTNGLIAYVATGTTREYRLIVAANEPGVYFAMSLETTTTIAGLCMTTISGKRSRSFVQSRTLPNGAWGTPGSIGDVAISSTSSSYPGIIYSLVTASTYNATYTITYNVHYDTRQNLLTEAYNNKVTTNIEKINDGYTTIAWVKYKTGSTTTSNTPVLISTVDSYTFFSNAHNETFTALYNGKRFYFSFSYATDNANPVGILTLDYTGSEYPAMSPALLFNYVANSVALTVTETGDPWGDTPSEPGGGDGDTDTGDDVPFATPPTSSAVASGFVTLFTPDLATLNAVAAYMWSSSFDIDQIKKIFANPIDAILGLHIVPCAISPAGQKEIKVAGFGTGQTSGYTTNQYVTVSCGSVAIPKKWGSYLDYSPYTKTQIWLPFIGFREIDIDDIQGKTISLQYIIDILSGACVAEVLIPCDDGTSSVLYSFTGSCAAEIPITSADMRGAISAALSIAGSAVAAAATVASGGATAPMAAGVIASTAVNSMALKPTIQRSGTASGAAGYLAQRTPYIVREQPNIALPSEQNKLTGYPSFVTVSLDTLSGYNEIAHIHLENIPGTDAEISEIENLLHSGVIF